jgi:ribosomal-protein-alanine N-acetyltransferase
MPKMRELETERLLLREFREADLHDVASWEGIPHAQEFLEFCFRQYRECGMGSWGLLLKETKVMAGNCAFYRIALDHKDEELDYCAEVNYYVARQYRGRGLAPEALKALLGFGFSDIGLTRIRTRCSPENVNSLRVMQKAGLKFERIVEAPGDGSPTEILYAIVREDFKAVLTSSRFGSNP